MTGADLGRATQARFLLDAHTHGFLVSIPWDSVPGYDALVDTGRKVLRVQIKGARPSTSRKTSGTYTININRHRRKRPRFDLLAVWLDGDAKWIFLPGKLCRVIQLRIRPNGRFHKYSSRWDLFG